MSTNSGIKRNPYQRMLLRRGVPFDVSGAGSSVPKDTTVEDAEETTTTEETTEITETEDKDLLGGEYKPGITAEEKLEIDRQLNNSNLPLNGFKLEEKTPGIISGLTEKARGILNEVFKRTNGNVVITSGLRSPEENTRIGGNPNSFHLKGDAIDLRPSPELDAFLTSAEGLKWLSSSGYEAVDERTQGGTGAHWHLEPKPQKMLKGGLIYKRK